MDDAPRDALESSQASPSATLQIAPPEFTETECILALSGQLTRDTASLLETQAAAAVEAMRQREEPLPEQFIFDLARVAYIDAQGLRALVISARIVHIPEKAKNPDFIAFRGARGQPLRLLKESHFDILYLLLP